MIPALRNKEIFSHHTEEPFLARFNEQHGVDDVQAFNGIGVILQSERERGGEEREREGKKTMSAFISCLNNF